MGAEANHERNREMTESSIKNRAITVHKLNRARIEALELPRVFKEIEGVLSARLDEENERLFIVYDLEFTDYSQIDELLEYLGFVQEDTVWQDLKESFIHFAEENEKAHLDSHADVVSYSKMEEIDEIIEGD